jgi:hypothetical protein
LKKKGCLLFFAAFVFLMVFSCNVGCEPTNKFEKEPLDQVIKEYSNFSNFSIILNDMNYDEGDKKYKHQYKVIHEPLEKGKDTLLQKTTDWKIVSELFFKKHLDNMGMEIASKKDGVLKKTPAPPGFSNYVGNESYGQWQTNSSGTSFWEFYGQYAFMSSMFSLLNPVGYSTWGDSRRDYDRGRPYYGSGSNTYGTNSPENKSARPNSSWNNKTSDFKSRVRNKVQRSTTTRSSVKRSSSRYNQSRMRSRSGGFGK